MASLPRCPTRRLTLPWCRVWVVAMNRRTMLKWASSLLALFSGILVAVPGCSFVLAVLRRRGGQDALVQRVLRLEDLPPGEPVEVPIVGRKRDAWTVYDQQTIGRVWLVRRSKADVPPEKSKVDAYSAICPHLACIVGLDQEDRRFRCPCHEAAFDLSGRRVPASELGHPNPSPRDLDPLKCAVVHDADEDAWWVEVTYQRFRAGARRRIPESV